MRRTRPISRYADNIRQQPGFVQEAGRIGCTDPNGLSVRLQVTRKRQIDVECAEHNTWSSKHRINKPSPAYERATPIEVGHVVFFVKDVVACERFYLESFGFAASDHYPGRGAFLRCAPEGGHHDIFLLQRPAGDSALNHVAFTVRDIHEVFGGGMHICAAAGKPSSARAGIRSRRLTSGISATRRAHWLSTTPTKTS